MRRSKPRPRPPPSRPPALDDSQLLETDNKLKNLKTGWGIEVIGNRKLGPRAKYYIDTPALSPQVQMAIAEHFGVAEPAFGRKVAVGLCRIRADTVEQFWFEDFAQYCFAQVNVWVHCPSYPIDPLYWFRLYDFRLRIVHVYTFVFLILRLREEFDACRAFLLKHTSTIAMDLCNNGFGWLVGRELLLDMAATIVHEQCKSTRTKFDLDECHSTALLLAATLRPDPALKVKVYSWDDMVRDFDSALRSVIGPLNSDKNKDFEQFRSDGVQRRCWIVGQYLFGIRGVAIHLAIPALVNAMIREDLGRVQKLFNGLNFMKPLAGPRNYKVTYEARTRRQSWNRRHPQSWNRQRDELCERMLWATAVEFERNIIVPAENALLPTTYDTELIWAVDISDFTFYAAQLFVAVSGLCHTAYRHTIPKPVLGSRNDFVAPCRPPSASLLNGARPSGRRYPTLTFGKGGLLQLGSSGYVRIDGLERARAFAFRAYFRQPHVNTPPHLNLCEFTYDVMFQPWFPHVMNIMRTSRVEIVKAVAPESFGKRPDASFKGCTASGVTVVFLVFLARGYRVYATSFFRLSVSNIGYEIYRGGLGSFVGAPLAHEVVFDTLVIIAQTKGNSWLDNFDLLRDCMHLLLASLQPRVRQDVGAPYRDWMREFYNLRHDHIPVKYGTPIIQPQDAVVYIRILALSQALANGAMLASLRLVIKEKTEVMKRKNENIAMFAQIARTVGMAASQAASTAAAASVVAAPAAPFVEHVGGAVVEGAVTLGEVKLKQHNEDRRGTQIDLINDTLRNELRRQSWDLENVVTSKYLKGWPRDVPLSTYYAKLFLYLTGRVMVQICGSDDADINVQLQTTFPDPGAPPPTPSPAPSTSPAPPTSSPAQSSSPAPPMSSPAPPMPSSAPPTSSPTPPPSSTAPPHSSPAPSTSSPAQTSSPAPPPSSPAPPTSSSAQTSSPAPPMSSTALPPSSPAPQTTSPAPPTPSPAPLPSSTPPPTSSQAASHGPAGQTNLP